VIQGLYFVLFFTFGAVLCYLFHDPSGCVVYFLIVSKAARFSETIFDIKDAFLFFLKLIFETFPTLWVIL